MTALTAVNRGEIKRHLESLSTSSGVDQASALGKAVARCKKKVCIWRMTKPAGW